MVDAAAPFGVVGPIVGATRPTGPHAETGRGAHRAAAPCSLDRNPRMPAELGMATSTVCALLTRLGSPKPPNRYCRPHARAPIHLKGKRLGRYAGLAHRRICARPATRPALAPARSTAIVAIAIDDITIYPALPQFIRSGQLPDADSVRPTWLPQRVASAGRSSW